jgi:hypothetical protein
MYTRLWSFAFALALTLLWTFPRVNIAYTRWDDKEWSWVTSYTVSLGRPFVADVSFAEYDYSVYDDPSLGRTPRERRMAASDRPYASKRQNRIAWFSQILQTVLVAGVFLGVKWVKDGKAPSRWRLRSR